jgi:ELWxxDGT repeat protein
MKQSLLLLLSICSFYAHGQITLVHEFVPGPTGTAIGNLCVYNNKLFFYTDAINGAQLWSYDAGGPSLVYNMHLSNKFAQMFAPLSFVPWILPVNGKLYYSANNDTTGIELWSYDGSTNPKLVHDIEPGLGNANVGGFITVQNKLYFNATTSLNGRELWEYDPAANVTLRISDLMPGVGDGAIGPQLSFNNKVYFSGRTSATGQELYVYDPVTKNINLAADINPGPGLGGPLNLTPYNDKLYFTATEPNYGRELYSYDSTSGFKRLTDIKPGPIDGIDGCNTCTGLYNNAFYFNSIDVNGGYTNIYKYDLINNIATKLHGDFAYSVTFMTVYNGKLYFDGRSKNPDTGDELWCYDGLHDPYLAADIWPGPGTGTPGYLTVYNGSLYFAALTPATGDELYKYNEQLGVQNTRFEGEIATYPNPCIDELHIDLTLKQIEFIDIVITNMQGHQVYQSGLKQYSVSLNTLVIPVNNLVAGCYFYTLVSADGVTLKSDRFVKR